MTRRDGKHMAALEVDAIGTALGPRVRLTVEGMRVLMTIGEAQRLGQWLWDAAELAELDKLEGCAHCHDDPPEGHACPVCGRATP